MFTTLYVNFSDAQGQITLESVVVSGRNSNSSKLSCMSSLPARMRMIESKMKELECSQDYSHYKSMGIFPDAQGQLLGPIWPNFELVRDVMDVLVTCKYEEDQIKNEGARVFTTFSPIITLWELSVAMDTRVPIRSGSKPNAALAPLVAEIFKIENVYRHIDVHTDVHTDRQRLDWHTISSPLSLRLR